MIVNDRDTLLQAAPQRFSTASTGIVLSGVSTIRTAADGTSPNPATVTLNAVLLGVSGTLSWSVTGGTLSGSDNTSRNLAASSMAGDVATVTVSLTYAGASYSAKFSIAKVRDGSAGTGTPGADGAQVAVARLYQWSTVAPARPVGSSTLTWANASNDSYTGSDGWAIAVPANPGTPGVRLYVASVSVTATAKAITSTVSYAAAAVEAWSQNGANGTNGVQSGAATVYQWAATMPAGPAGSASFKWSDGSFGAAPSNWTLTPGTSPSPGMTLFAARVQVTDSAVAITTAFNWSTAAIMAIGYAGSNGGNGAAGASYVTAYCASATGSATSAPAATTGKSSVPAANSGGITGTWSATVPALSDGQYMYQSDGIYDPTTDKITWSIPYWSSLKVATLSAITANLGTINAGSINLGGGTFTVDNDGNLVCRSIKILNPDGSTMLQAGGRLNPVNAAPGTLNADLAPSINNAATTATWGGVTGEGKPEDNANFTSASKGAALNDDPNIENLAAWVVDSGVVRSSSTNVAGAVGLNYFYVSSAQDARVTTKRSFAVDPAKTYNLTAALFASAGNNRNMYIFVNFYDASGNQITGTGWGGAMSGYTFGDNPPTGAWTRLGNLFGVGTGRPIPAGARTANIGVWFQYSGGGSSAVGQGAMDIRIEEVTIAAKAAADAAAANAALAAIADDNTLSRGEKPDVILQWNAANVERTSLVPQANALGVNANAYGNAQTALGNYLSALAPAWNDLTRDTPILGTDFRAVWSAYYDEKQKLINAMAAAASTKANWGNVANRPADDTIRNNMTDLAWWAKGNAIPWTQNAEYNVIADSLADYGIVGPKGVSEAIWLAQETAGDSGPGGGWYGASMTLDPTKTYRFVIPIRRLSGSGAAYWGIGQGTINNLNDTLNASNLPPEYYPGEPTASNPYFCSANLTQTDRWYLFIGYIYPAGSRGNTSDSAGIWDCKTGQKVVNGLNFNFKAGVTVHAHRAYQFYATSGARQAFGRPMVNVVDGTEPSLRDYFGGAVLGQNVSGTMPNVKDYADNLGTFVSAGTARTQISDLGIRVYDGSNNLRIKIGQL